MRPVSHRLLPAGWYGLLIAAALLLQAPLALAQERAIRLKVVGGLADVSQYVRFEEPFWRQRVPELTGGRVTAEIAPFDRAGIRGEEMLQLMQLGVVPFGTVLLSLAATEEPELNAVDLPALSPDLATLRRTVAAYRPHLENLLRERFGIELLATYTYPAQVVFCNRAFDGLAGLAGRRVRTSSVAQSEMVQALGATPVVTPFAEIVPAMRAGVVECAVTGTLSGHAIGLYEVTTHVHAMAITWGIAVFGANANALNVLPRDVQAQLLSGLQRLEAEIWDAADRETGEGLACVSGQPSCTLSRRGSMVIVPVSATDDERRRRLLTEVVLPRWVGRCGSDCVEAWNQFLAPVFGIRAVDPTR